MSDWRNTSDMVANKIKVQLHSRKTDHLDNINKWSQVYDPQDQGKLTKYDFEQFLKKIGIYLSTQELRCLYDVYVPKEENPEKLVNYKDFLLNVRDNISSYRLSIIKSAWQFLDQGKQGRIAIKELIARYQSSQHPRCRTRQKSVEEIQQEFENAIIQKSADQQSISEQEFLQYYVDINLLLSSEKDEYFSDIIFKTWGITSGPDYVSPERIADLEIILYEKIRQKTFTKTDEGLTAFKTFKYFDLADTGYITYDLFCQALRNFGCNFDEKELLALFGKYDTDSTGKINYQEFSKLFANLGSGYYPNINPIYDELRKVPQDIIQKIQKLIQEKGSSKEKIGDLMYKADIYQQGTIPRDLFQEVLIKQGIILTKFENDALYRHFDDNFSDKINYNEFISYL